MIIAYEDSQKARLVAEVDALCRQLGRPVSAKDLAARWKAMPECRPILLQGVGQLLLKASRPVKGDNPVLRQVGTIGNLGFYAADDDTAWVEAFRRNEIAVRAARHVKWAIPEHALYLLGTEHDGLSRNALAGFVAEWAGAAADTTIALPTRIHELLDVAKKHAAGEFVGPCPELIGRREASNILVADFASAIGQDNPCNLNRHLARLSWPMTTLFSQVGFWEFQVRQYCASKWPDETTDAIFANAAYLLAVYGQRQPGGSVLS